MNGELRTDNRLVCIVKAVNDEVIRLQKDHNEFSYDKPELSAVIQVNCLWYVSLTANLAGPQDEDPFYSYCDIILDDDYSVVFSRVLHGLIEQKY